LVASEDVIIEPGRTVIIPTGLAIALPPGYECQIRPRSGITLKTKLRVQLGTVDSGYTGPVGVIVDNIAQQPESPYPEKDYYLFGIDGKDYDVAPNEYLWNTYIIRKGDRLAQCVINQVEQAQFQVVEELDETERGAGGFGSSGVTSE